MRTEPLKKELRKIRGNLYHAFHDRTSVEQANHHASQPFEKRRDPTRRWTTRDLMQRRPISVRSDSLLEPAIALMTENLISGVPVVDAEGRIVGALNENDLLKLFYEPDAMSVASVMTHDPVAVSVDAPLVDVVDQLMSSDLPRVLVHEDRRLVGIITRSDLMPAILQALQETVRARGADRKWTVGDRTQH